MQILKLVSILVFAPISAIGQTYSCDAFLTNPIFTKSTTTASQSAKDRFKSLLCSASWKSSKEAQYAGIDITVPIYDIPVPIEANWSNDKVEQWKTSNCSAQEKNSNFQTNYYQTVYSVNPITAKAALECVNKSVEAEIAGAKALRCRINEGASVVMFEAEWRRTAGESANPPSVVSFNSVNTTCLGADTVFKSGTNIVEGGVAVMCPVSGTEAPAVSLNTSRGSCTVSGAPRLPAITLPPRLDLTGPYFLSGQEVVIPANSKIVTNGFPFSLRADKLRIQGSAQIVSFEPRAVPNMQPGRFASQVEIVAKDVVGAGMSILNAGEPGGAGNQGPQGGPGPQGGAGQGRSPTYKQCGPLQFACDAVLLGCTGGQDGGAGGQGAQGFQGLPGAPGGGAADVILDVSPAGQAAFRVLTDVNVAGQAAACGGSICGGLGGKGGPGGAGGPGGPGGPGAPGTTWCGGTNTGPSGPAGAVGPEGQVGPEGTRGFVQMR